MKKIFALLAVSILGSMYSSMTSADDLLSLLEKCRSSMSIEEKIRFYSRSYIVDELSTLLRAEGSSLEEDRKVSEARFKSCNEIGQVISSSQSSYGDYRKLDIEYVNAFSKHSLFRRYLFVAENQKWVVDKVISSEFSFAVVDELLRQDEFDKDAIEVTGEIVIPPKINRGFE